MIFTAALWLAALIHEQKCEEFHCPEKPAGCQIATPKQVKPGTCPKRCDIVHYPPGAMSRNSESIVREMFSSVNAQGLLQIALERGILVSATESFRGEDFEIRSSPFSPPPGDYVILFRDPVTCNVIARDQMIVEPIRQ